MENNNTKNLIIAGIAIIIVIAVAIAIPHFKHTKTAPTTPIVAADTTATQPADDTAASVAAWYDLFQKYDGKIVVFGADCNTTPHLQNQPKGTTILLMNNGTVPHTITIAGSSYVVGAYHYKTYTLNTTGAAVIDCDNHKSVAAIVLQ